MGGGQGGFVWRSEAFVKIQKKNYFFLGGGAVGGRVRRGAGQEGVVGQGGQLWGGGGVRVDGNGELKLL